MNNTVVTNLQYDLAILLKQIIRIEMHLIVEKMWHQVIAYDVFVLVNSYFLLGLKLDPTARYDGYSRPGMD